ncbi:MAG: hypothetical protein HQL52_08665 [Magnetococcales bacterium]|nr:hypothetical protein [Magnetococcales bacterium]
MAARVPVPAPPASVQWLLLLLLPVMALGVWLDGAAYDPDRARFKPGGKRIPMAAFLPERLGNLFRLNPVKGYDKANLFEYINGHAEFFIDAGFVNLAVGEYGGEKGAASPAVVVDIYDLQKPLHAFGVLMDEAARHGEPVEVGEMGFASEAGLAFISGPYYIKLAAFDSDTPLMPLARGVHQVIGGAGGEQAQAFAFPDLGETTRTRFIKESYRGLDFFSNVVERSFDLDGRELTAFLLTGSPEEKRQTTTALKDFLAGEEIPNPAIREAGVEWVTVMDPYEDEWFFVWSEDRFLGVFAPLTDELKTRIQAYLAL